MKSSNLEYYKESNSIVSATCMFSLKICENSRCPSQFRGRRSNLQHVDKTDDLAYMGKVLHSIDHIAQL